MDAELKAELRVTWENRGFVKIDDNGKLVFPKLNDGPNLYRFSIYKADGSRLSYIGETANLARRLAHYRSPGPSQPTNKRMNSLCKEALSQGGTIEIDVVSHAWTKLNDVDKRADFQSKEMRRLFENLVLAVGGGQEVSSLNR